MLKKSAILTLALLSAAGLSLAEATSARTPQAPRAYVPAPATDGAAKGAIYVDDMDGANDTTGLRARGYQFYYRGTGPQGTTFWFQGNETVFPAYNGPANGYVGANYNAVTGANNIDNWLVLPAIPGGIRQGDSLYFYSRSPDGGSWPDSIRVMYSASDTLPEGNWVELGRFKVTTAGSWELKGFEAPITAAKGRFAIRYCVINGGPTGANSNYIGIDAISIVTHQDSLEIIGASTNTWSGAPRIRGNFFLCDVNTIVKEYRWYLNPADTANVWFTIYEGDSAGGTYNRIFSRMVRTPDTVAGWYTTGPMDARMEAGKYYFYAMIWDASVPVAYFRSGVGANPYPYPYSFGDLVGLCGYSWTSSTTVTPPQDTLEVAATAFSGNMAYYQALVTVPDLGGKILVFEETPGDTAHYYLQAANNLGFTTCLVTSQAAFVDSLYNGTPWKMALVNQFSYTPIAGFFDTLNHFIGNGGRMIFFTYAYGYAGSLYNSLGASYIAGLTTPVNVHANDPTDVLFTSPNEVSTIYWKNDIYFTNCIRLAPVNGGVAAAYLEGYPGEAGLIVNGAQTAIINGFESVNYTGDDDGDGKLDMVELIENEITWLLDPVPVGVEGGPSAPLGDRVLWLGANRPNPFRTGTTIEFALPKAGKASLKVYNVLGQAVATLVEGNLPAGPHRASWNAKGVANGIYLYRLEANGQRLTRKLAVIK